MARTRITVLLFITALLLGKWGLDQVAGPIAGSFEGTWEIASVQRDGVADLTHVGSHLTFVGNRVRLQSWFPVFDGTSSGWTVANPSGKNFVNFDPAEAERQSRMAARS